MTPYYEGAGVTLYVGDCLTVLPTLDAESADAIITDPPYHLTTGKKGGSGEASDNPNSPAGRSRVTTGFMGKVWDGGDVAFKVETWREVLRVAKPGAHLVAFGGTRTHHRLMCAIEDAGWEIRDCLMWLYGSGFPKSLDVSKAIDKLDASDERLARARRFQSWLRDILTPQEINAATGSDMGHHLTTHPTQPAIPTERIFAPLRPLVGDVPVWVEELVRERTVESENFKAREVTGEARMVDTSAARMGFAGPTYNDGRSAPTKIVPITAAHTDAAREWDGWGTALKPAWEPIILARKPLAGTVAANVLQHGTGALNIDASRIATTDSYADNRVTRGGDHFSIGSDERTRGTTFEPAAAGRWPANVVLDEEAARLLDEQSGDLQSGTAHVLRRGGTTGKGMGFGSSAAGNVDGSALYGDLGGASRFFYTAKASKADRFSEAEGGNTHPTVKPLDLMQWLVRLVTPPGGLILDPFMGSGTTIKAAHSLNFRAIGIDLEEAHAKIALGRLSQEVLDLSGATSGHTEELPA